MPCPPPPPPHTQFRLEMLGECHIFDVKLLVKPASDPLLYTPIEVSDSNPRVPCPEQVTDVCKDFKGVLSWYQVWHLSLYSLSNPYLFLMTSLYSLSSPHLFLMTCLCIDCLTPTSSYEMTSLCFHPSLGSHPFNDLSLSPLSNLSILHNDMSMYSLSHLYLLLNDLLTKLEIFVGFDSTPMVNADHKQPTVKLATPTLPSPILSLCFLQELQSDGGGETPYTAAARTQHGAHGRVHVCVHVATP